MGLSRTIYNNVLLAVDDIINSNCHFAGPVSHLAPCDVFTGCCKITWSISLEVNRGRYDDGSGPALRRRVSSAIALELVRRKHQAPSSKLDR